MKIPNVATQSGDNYFGWLPMPGEVEKVLNQLERPLFGCAAPHLKGTGKGKKVILYDAQKAVVGRWLSYAAQQIGDCVGHMGGRVTDIVTNVRIAVKGKRELWLAKACSEAAYALSRVEIGGGRLGNNDGSTGAWMAKALKQYGNLLRREYTAGGETFDLRKYSGALAKAWGRTGLPDALEPIAKEHPFRTVSLVDSYEEARDAIANGYPVGVCSMQGFEGATRDKDGFISPRGTWPHAMVFGATWDDSKRPGLALDNKSWPDSWVKGPLAEGLPPGTAWVAAETCDRMLRGKDSFAYSQYEGYPAQDLDYMMI